MEKKNIMLSVALAVKNEEKNIRACLSSVQNISDEIVVVDGGSSDKTVEIAKTFGAVVIETDNPRIFHINKQKALDACHGKWILQLDADEVVTKELANEILQTIHHPSGSTMVNGYFIPRKNYFWGHFMRKGGQYPDYVIRLIKKGKAVFPCKSVHEQIQVDGEVGYLNNPLLHYAYRTKRDYWKKADLYITLTVDDFRRKNVKKTIRNWLYFMIVKPFGIFMNLFIRHKGFMDGWYGFLFAYWSALHYPIAWKKYIKSITYKV